MNEWISKMWYVHTMEYNSALKREGNTNTCTTRMYPEDITLREVSQSQKDKY